MNKFIVTIVCAMMLSSCALLTKISSPDDILNKVTGNTGVAVPVPTEDIRG